MKHLRVFIGAMTRTLFTSVVGWTLNIITFVALWVSVTFQSLPLWVWIAIAVVNIFIAMFLAWRKERQRAKDLEADY